MANDISFLPSNKLSKCWDINYAKVDQKIDALDSFEVRLGHPTGWQITDIVDDVEANITIGSHAVYGYVKNHQYDRSKGLLTIKGWDYMIKLAGMFIHTDNVTQEDAGLSSAFRVVYTTKAFAVIAADLITNSGFGVGTINTFPVAGPDTNMSVKYEDMYVRDGLKYLANYANVSNVTYDLWIDTSKDLQLQDRRGNATSVKDYNDGINCNVVNFEGDTIRKAKRVLLRGDRSGASQMTGVWPAAGFTPGDPEVGFYMPGLTDQTMATQLAKNLYTALGGEITFIELKSGDVGDNVQLGDLITLTSKDLSIIATDYRVVRIIREYWRDRESLKLFLSVSTNKQRKKTMAELFSGNKGLTRLTGSVTKGEIKTLTFGFIGKTHGTNKNQAVINLSTSDIAADGDIIAARLKFKRLAITYDVGANTDGAQTGDSVEVIGAPTTDSVEVIGAPTTDSVEVIGAPTTDSVEILGAGGSSAVASADSGGFAGNNLGTGWGNIYVYSAGGVGWHCSDLLCWVNLRHSDGVNTHTGYVRFEYWNGGGTYFPNSNGFRVQLRADRTNCVEFYCPEDAYGHQLRVQFRWAVGTRFIYSQSGYTAKALHVHDDNFSNPVQNHGNNFSNPVQNHGNNFSNPVQNHGNNFSNPEHQNPLTRSVYLPGGEAAHNFNIDIGGVNRATANNINVGNVSSEIDLSTWINTRGTHYVEIYPTGAAEKATIVGEIQVDYWSEKL